MSNIWQGRTNHALCGPIKGEFPQTEKRMILDFPTIEATKFWLFILNYDFVKNIFYTTNIFYFNNSVGFHSIDNFPTAAFPKV